jgi:hypothetical protein
MTETIQKTMRAAAINRFGGIEEIKLQMLPVPEIEPDEVLIRIESAGSGHLGRIRARWRLRQVCSALSEVSLCAWFGWSRHGGGQLTRFSPRRFCCTRRA